MMKVLHLTVKRKWFDMIASGEKKEDYREIKMYWATRLCNGFQNVTGIDRHSPDFKDFDYVQIKDGYNRPRTINLECLGIEIGFGKEKWGASGKELYIIKLGNILK